MKQSGSAYVLLILDQTLDPERGGSMLLRDVIEFSKLRSIIGIIFMDYTLKKLFM
jgi:hypothetical protein